MKLVPFLGILSISCTASLANQAVSAVNGKLAVESGNMNSESSTIAEGSVAWPIQESFGAQLDGLYSTTGQRTFGDPSADSEPFGGVGGHFIWRDSESAMLGLQAGYVFSDPVDSYELAVEGERYFKWLTVGAKLGVAGIEFDQASPLIETDKDAFFGQFYLSAYPIDNLLISAMVENRFDNTFVSLEVEYELPVPGLSIFANAMKGANSYDQAFVGMRYYFGEEMPLKSRHRKSDPKSQLPGMVYGIGTYQAEMWSQALNQSRRISNSSGSSGGGSKVPSTFENSAGANPTNGSGRSFGGSESDNARNSSGGTATYSSGSSTYTAAINGTAQISTNNGQSIGGSGSIGTGTVKLGGGTLTLGPGSGSGTMTLGPGNGSGTLTLGPGYKWDLGTNTGGSFQVP